MRKIVSIILLTILGSGCSRQVIVEPVPLPLPLRPVLTEITDDENKRLQQWDVVIYKKILRRELQLKYHIRDLEAVIRSTHVNSQ